MKRVLALVLAGGSAEELSVLTEMRTVTALPFGGKYRVIDFTLSNLSNSEIYSVGILTQRSPLSLHAHVGIGKPWDLDRRSGGIHLLQPYQRQAAASWYLGTADAVRQNLDVVENSRAKWVLIVPGDLVYKMDYSWLLKAHQERDSEVTLAVGPVDAGQSHRFGMVTVDADDRVTGFEEKPVDSAGGFGFTGVAVFNAGFLARELEEHPEAHNLVTEIIQPIVARGGRVDAYHYAGYWEDVGTLQAFYRASMDLLQDAPRLNLYDPEWIIYTRSEELPPAHIGEQATIDRSLLANGCVVHGRVENSILFPGVRVEPGAVVRDSIVMNGTRVRPGAVLDHVISDKNVDVGENAVVGDGEIGEPPEDAAIKVDGLTVLGRDATIESGTRIGRYSVVNPVEPS